MGGPDSVGTLLADVARLLADGTRILSLADKRLWGPDEHEQERALDDALDDAKRDFQQLSPLVNGQSYYEHDRRHESVAELRALRARFQGHLQCLRDWARSGGPINPVWVRDTHALQRDLHRAQCRAARRIFTSDHESSQRCLGAFLVRRIHPGAVADSSQNPNNPKPQALAVCSQIGGFERFGENDMAFICDFCDGHLIWDDLEGSPTVPAPAATTDPNSPYPRWQAVGNTVSGPLQKQVVYAPLAIANHVPPRHGDWQATLLCPFCEDEARQPRDIDDDDDVHRPDNEFDDVAALQEHLEWQHTAAAMLPAPALPSKSCGIM